MQPVEEVDVTEADEMPVITDETSESAEETPDNQTEAAAEVPVVNEVIEALVETTVAINQPSDHLQTEAIAEVISQTAQPDSEQAPPNPRIAPWWQRWWTWFRR